MAGKSRRRRIFKKPDSPGITTMAADTTVRASPVRATCFRRPRIPVRRICWPVFWEPLPARQRADGPLFSTRQMTWQQLPRPVATKMRASGPISPPRCSRIPLSWTVCYWRPAWRRRPAAVLARTICVAAPPSYLTCPRSVSYRAHSWPLIKMSETRSRTAPDREMQGKQGLTRHNFSQAAVHNTPQPTPSRSRLGCISRTFKIGWDLLCGD